MASHLAFSIKLPYLEGLMSTYYVRQREGKETGRDSTRISKLSIEQLYHLYCKVDDTTVNTHGLPLAYESFWCHETTSSLTVKGYPNSRRLHPDREFGPYDYRGISVYTGFRQGTIVLAVEGIFAENADDDCSHLCGQKKCLRASHLCYEHTSTNQARNLCPAWIWCDNKQLICACKCTPICKRISIGTTFAE